MYFRGRAFVQGVRRNGEYGDIDVVDLDRCSFAAWVVATLHSALGGVSGISLHGKGPAQPYREAEPEVRRPKRPKAQRAQE
jgi:hypothetical protein